MALLAFVPLLAALVTPTAAPGSAAGMTWGWPLPAPHHVVRGFDPPVQPWLAGHRGVDLAGHDGEVVLAAGAGVISFAGVVAHVPVVSVRHPDGLLTTYQPVTTRRKAGAAVTAGQAIGHLALTGSHCAPAACLHWGLRRGSDYLDPLALLHLNPVRLLPLDPDPGSLPRLPAVGAATASLGIGAGALARAGRLSRRRRARQPRAPSRVACRR